MATRYIYINDQLNDKLRKEENASALICSLLTEHYKQKDLIGMTEEELLLELKKNEIIERAQKEIQELTK